jgi:hypothetical protein
MANHPHVPGPDNSKAAPDYVIGYGRPPVDGTFKNGHPKLGGRRKGQRNRRTVVHEVLNATVTMRRGKRSHRMTKFEAMITKTADNAVLGNAKALSTIIAVIRQFDLMGEPHETTQAEPFTVDDPELIADFLKRNDNQAESAQSPRSDEKSESGKGEPPSRPNKENKEKKA